MSELGDGLYAIKPTTASQQLSQRLRSYRETWHVSQAWVAKRAGTTQRVISAIESGSYNPSLALAERIAEAMNAKLVLHFSRAMPARYTRKQ
jgi:DNA-binding XRE family transcriptional regulator